MSLYNALEFNPSVKYATAHLIHAIEEVSGCQIRSLAVNMERDELRGMLAVFDSPGAFSKWLDQRPGYKAHLQPISDGAKGVGLVILSSKINDCWKRFTLIKEASHLLFEADELITHSTDIQALAKAVVDIPALGRPDAQAELFVRDYAGIAAALELLMPAHIKENVSHWVNVDKQTPYQVAEKLRIPEKFVEIRLNQWSLPGG